MHDFISEETSSLNDNPVGPAGVREEISALKDALNQTRTEVARLRRRIDRQQAEAEAHARRGSILLAVTVLVSAGMIAAFWYGSFGKGSVGVSVPATPKQSGTTDHAESKPPVPDVYKNNTIVPTQSATSASVSEFQSSLRNESAAAIQDATIPNDSRKTKSAEATGFEPGSESSARPRGTSGTAPSALLSDSIDRTRVEFKLTNNRTVEVSPGLFLTVRSTDVTHQQVDGWLQVAEDGKTIWLRSQSADKVVIFNTKRDTRSRGLVFTNIDKQGVAGYFLIPQSSG